MIFVLTGTNDFMRQTELEEIQSQFLAEYGDMGLERLDGEEAEFQRIYDALTSLPFLSSRKMAVIKNPSASKELVEKAEGLFKNLSETTDLILVEPKFDKRSSFYKLLKKISDFREFNELDAGGLARWLINRAKAKNGSLAMADAQYLVERIGTSQQMLASELDKLMLYNPTITRGSIELLTEQAPQSTIFELLDAAFNGNTKKALKIYAEQRALKVEPQQIIAMLAWQLNILAFIKTAGDRSPDTIAKEAKLNPYVVKKSSTIAHRLSLADVRKLIQDTLSLDVKLKTEAIDADEALQNFLLRI